MTTQRLVLIEWVDSFGCASNWEEIGHVESPERQVCRSVGWLVVDDENSKVIVPHVAKATKHTEEQGCGDMTIPTPCVLRIVDLQEVGDV